MSVGAGPPWSASLIVTVTGPRWSVWSMIDRAETGAPVAGPPQFCKLAMRTRAARGRGAALLSAYAGARPTAARSA
eukprot:scaffold56641_cov53-Phaeocystis_antarctica.AAC.4